jgi:hypothetical protein
VKHLDSECQNYRQVLTNVTPRIGRLPLIEVEYALAMRTAEREWVSFIINDVRTGKLNWNPEILQKPAQFLATCQQGKRPKRTIQN